jgi:hypothetical protein
MFWRILTVLAIMISAAGQTYGQDTLNVWVGGKFHKGVWKDTMNVKTDEWINVPVYFSASSSDVALADICFPLAYQLACIDSVEGGDINFPFSEWDIKEFKNSNDEKQKKMPAGPMPAGWKSLSFVAFARVVRRDNPWFNSEDIINVFSYRAHTAKNKDLKNKLICDAFKAGKDPIQGPANAGDTLGGPGYRINQKFCCLLFQ